MYEFSVLQKLNVTGTAVSGDIRTIGLDNFPVLKDLALSKHVYGGGDLQRVHDAPSLMEALYQFKKRLPNVGLLIRRWRLARDSPDHYNFHNHHSRAPLFLVEFVQVGSRTGWQWTNAVSQRLL